MHTMGYYSALEMKFWYMLQHGWTLKTLYYVKSASDKVCALWFHLHEGPRVVQREWWLPEAGEEEMSLTSKVLALEDQRVLEVDSGGDCRKMWMYLMPLNCALKSD